MSRSKILIAGGGTGGHVFPAIAVGDALQALADVDIVFCGTVRGIEARIVPARGWPLEQLHVEPMKGRRGAQRVRAVIVAGSATARAFGLLSRLPPHAVLSVGGYASGPVTLAAALRRIPVAVLEPNRIIGLANLLISPFAKRAYVAWDEAAIRFRRTARRAYGVPLRRGFAPCPYTARGTARVLVMGGSQGSAALNERMPGAIARLAGSIRELEVVHQAGHDRDAAVRSAYERQGVQRVVVVPFLDDVAAAIADADVVVARAGAVTIAEIAAIGRAAILVPYPHAADDHQGHNADALALAGAAICVRQKAADPARLATEIERLLHDDAVRASIADAARSRGKPTAAIDIATDLLDMAGVDERKHRVDGDLGYPHAPLDRQVG
ncbi:MAG: undecaprenyldiphospho-muramoylpentapeptide beta-N-acetylglucosaminyltransferase [Myxococcota bacterium]|nr:undecaprenyldiphospho-muramoylpentapeptide beta-N-acetylglucosaminyltransferase [Myxococcota bacterium]